MAAHIKCIKCGKEFYRKGKAVLRARYCSRLCQFHKPGGIILTREFSCIICQKKFVRRGKQTLSAKFCSALCKGKMVHTWHDKNRFKWKNASQEEKIDRARENFEKHIVKQDGCWDWNGAIHNTGYAVSNFGKKFKFAHIVSWLIHYGDYSKDLNVLHKCDNRKCTNPEHLFLGTHKENMNDRNKKGRCNPKFGIDHPFSKLSIDQVIEIKKLLSLGVTVRRIAQDFNMGASTINAIKSGKTWKHIQLDS